MLNLDEDSEPILGQWFEETLAPPENNESKLSNTDSDDIKSSQNERAHSIVPEKGEAHGYISLATNIFIFLNQHFLCSKSVYVTRYVKNGLTEQKMVILAAIIRDLDKETARTEVGELICSVSLTNLLVNMNYFVLTSDAVTGTISAYFGAALGQLYCEFSGALTRFTHNLVTYSTYPLQASLLNHLGVSPWNADVPHAWPLQVYPRTLSVLAQVSIVF